MVDQSRSAQVKSGRHAIVIGGSMAGLVTARVLTDHFDQVTVIDRDHFPDKPEARSGVPQGRHIHLLLTKGYQILEQTYPGLDAELVAGGAAPLDWCQDTISLMPTGWLPCFPSRLVSRTCTRPLLEWHVHNRVAANPKIRIIEGCEVTRLLSDASRTRVTGVQIEFRRGAKDESATGNTLNADLVVDATGRSSHTPDWLEALGYARPEETTINSFVAYATRWYERPATFEAGWKWLIVFARPPKLPRGAMIAEMEPGRWLVTVAGAAKDYLPTEEAGFLEFARSLPTPMLYDAIKDATPLTPIYGYQRTQNHWLHYERLTRWPENYVVTGDAVCGFNPIYGQGMTVAAMGALLLGTCLTEQRQHHPDGNLIGMGQQFQKRLAKANKTPWTLATGEDFRYPTTEGGKPDLVTRLMHRYVDLLQQVMPNNPKVTQAFVEVMHLIEPPTILFRPELLMLVLKQAFGGQKTGVPAGEAVPSLRTP